jgi:hypothetical protein
MRFLYGSGAGPNRLKASETLGSMIAQAAALESAAHFQVASQELREVCRMTDGQLGDLINGTGRQGIGRPS